MQNLLSSRLLSKNLKIKIYRTIILPIVFYGCETWSLTLREERTLRVFENMVLRRILGSNPAKDVDNISVYLFCLLSSCDRPATVWHAHKSLVTAEVDRSSFRLRNIK